MKNFIIILFLLSSAVMGQFKDQGNKPIDIKSGITNYAPSGFTLGFFNPDNFSMHHSVSMSYSSFGSQGLAMGVYTNNMMYKISDNLDVEADISIVNSPYSTLGDAFTNQLNGVYLSRAQLNYKPSKDFSITIQYNQLPNGFYSPYGYYDSPFYSRRNYWRN